jgi:23S rRNA-/tRNA-specific pseudouridylate synthase
MKNQSKKLNEAINIIRKHYSAVNVQRTDNEDVVYLFDYSNQKKTIGSEKINKAIEKSVKKQDFPKDVYYADGMLSVVQKQAEIIPVPAQIVSEIVEETAIVEETIIEEQPKKRGRKKQTELDAES